MKMHAAGAGRDNSGATTRTGRFWRLPIERPTNLSHRQARWTPAKLLHRSPLVPRRSQIFQAAHIPKPCTHATLPIAAVRHFSCLEVDSLETWRARIRDACSGQSIACIRVSANSSHERKRPHCIWGTRYPGCREGLGRVVEISIRFCATLAAKPVRHRYFSAQRSP